MSERQLEESSLTRKIVNPFQKKGVNVPKKALISRNLGMMAQANTQIEHHQDTSTTGPKAVLSSSSQQPHQRTQMYFTNEPAQKKGRRLRKNFDMLAHAMRTNQPAVPKSDKRELLSGGFLAESAKGQYPGVRALNGQGMGSSSNLIDPTGSVFSQVQIVQNLNRNGAHSAHANQANDLNQQLMMYGGGAAQCFHKERKGSNSQAPSGYYDMLIAQIPQAKQGGTHSQSQRAGSQTSQRHNASHLIYNGSSIQAAPLHNTSLYSQISMKENSPQKIKKLSDHQLPGAQQSRNPNMYPGTNPGLMMFNQGPAHHNFSHQTQPLPIAGDPGARSNLVKKFGQMASNSTSRKSNENIMVHPQLQANQREIIQGGNPAILNINTASDINIYNNSFIVNTGGAGIGMTKKPQSHSQSNSRSSSLKRNIQGGTQHQLAKAPYNPGPLRQQMVQGKLVNLNSAGQAQQQTGAGGISLQNLLAMNNDYQSRVQSQQRATSRLSATSGAENLQKFNQITEAYTATNFFSNSGQVQNMPYPPNVNGKTSKKTIKLSNRKHYKQSSTGQQIPTQSNLEPMSNVSYDNQTSSLGVLRNPKHKSTGKISFATNASASKVKSSQSLHRLQPGDNHSGNVSMDLTNINQQLQSSPNLRGVQNRSTSQALLVQGKKKVADKDYKRAIALFSEALIQEPQNTDAKFYRAISQLDSGLLAEAVSELKDILDMRSNHSPVCHILLSIAFKRLNNQEQAYYILDECIRIFPQYPDAYLARGQAQIMNEKYDLALKDFAQYATLMPNNGMGFLGVGDSHKALRQWQHSVTAYTKAIQLFTLTPTPDEQLRAFTLQATLKRGLGYYHLQLNQQAFADFQTVLKSDPTSIKAHFHLGKILSKQYLGETPQRTDPPTSKQRQKLQNEAILHFEQVVKHHSASGEVYAGNALFEIAKLRLRDKDFYEAYFNLKRAVDSNFNSKRLQLYKDFTEGVLYLIKRKIKKGVQILSDLLEVLVNSKNKKDQKQLDYLRQQSYVYRAYGYVAIEKYEVALQDIKKAKRITKLDAASIYNKLLGKGILRMDHEDYIMATKYFTKASLKFPTNKDPYCLYIISMVRSYSYSHQGISIDQEEKREKIWQAKEFMDHAITNCNIKVKVPSLYFFRGLLYFQMHMFYEALQDFNVAIDEEEEPTAAYYMARGRAYACLSILSEAMKDLSISLNLDETLQEAYIYRGKCAYLLGDNNLAFLDFQRLILTDPKNPMVHVYAGNLLMTTGAYQDAIKAFLNADTVQKTAVAAFQRARCFCALTDLENAKMQFKIASQLCKTEELIKIDSQVLTALMRVINASQQSKQPQEAIKSIQAAIEVIDELIGIFTSDRIKAFRKKDSLLNIQIIPNVKRIKLEKIAVAKDIYQRSQAEEGKQIKLQDVSLGTEELMGHASVNLEELKEIPLHSYYYENVFSLEDLHLFRAVFSFYKGDYVAAIRDYEICQNLKYDGETKEQKGSHPYAGSSHDHMADSIKAYSQNSTPLLSMNSSKTDLSDVGLCSLNVHETNYNILLCYLLTRNSSKALEKINEIIGQTPGKYQRHFFLIRGLLYEEMGQKDKALKDYAKYEKQEPKSYEQYFKEGKDLQFEPFPIKNRLCSRFESIKLTHLVASQCRQAGLAPKICLKPSFSMPFIKPPNMIPNIDEEMIQGEFTLKQIDAPMPEAPWIRRWGGQNGEQADGIKFTDNMLLNEDDEDEEDDDNALAHFQQSEASQDVVGQNARNVGKQQNEAAQKQASKGKIQPPSKFNDESPYLQSIEVKPTTNAQRLKTQHAHSLGISEQIIKQANGATSNSIGNHGMMVYQFVGDVLDLDQLSDKHKISLFDESRYEDINGENSLKGQSLLPEEYQSTNIAGRKSQPKRRILSQRDEDALAGGDSLYDERLLNQDEEVQFEGNEEDDDDDDEEDSSDSEVEEQDEENEEGSHYQATKKPRKEELKVGRSSQMVPSMIGDSMVLMGENTALMKRKNVKKTGASKRQRPLKLELSVDGPQKGEKQRHLSQLEMGHESSKHNENSVRSDKESIFRSRQSSKR